MPQPTAARRSPRLTRLLSPVRAAFLAAVAALGCGGGAAAQAPQENMLRTAAANCFDMAAQDTRALAPLAALFNRMHSLPITGRPVIQRLLDPAYHYQICFDPSLPQDGMQAAYLDQHNRLFVPLASIPPESFYHEAFHAYQDSRGGIITESTPFVPSDMAMGLLLSEASAVGYSLMLMREYGFARPDLYAAFIANNDNAAGMGKTFDSAFTRAYALYGLLPEEARRRHALQAGGTAVVEALLSGQSKGWSSFYAKSAQKAAMTGDRTLNDNLPAYQAQRAEIFRRAGLVGDNLVIVPARFLGPHATDNIRTTLDGFGLTIRYVPRPEYMPRRFGS